MGPLRFDRNRKESGWRGGREEGGGGVGEELERSAFVHSMGI